MATIKNTSGDYTLNINGGAGLMTINGNLNVLGTTTQIESTNVGIWDNVITLNNGLSPGIVPTLNAGIEVDRGTQANVQIRWNETLKVWQINNVDKTDANFGNIATVGNAAISGNLNITGHTIYDTANTVTMYTGTVSSGKSGLFVDNTNGTQQELATKSAAIAYSIIFG